MITTDRAFSTLLGERQNLRKSQYGTPLLITISPSSKHDVAFKSPCKVEPKGIKYKPYGKIPQLKQYDYVMNLVEKIFRPYADTLVGVCELNASGNVHFHFLLQSDRIKDDIDLHIFRRNISQDPLVQKHTEFSDEKHFCHIVYCTDLDYIEEYLMKDNQKMTEKGFANYYYIRN